MRNIVFKAYYIEIFIFLYNIDIKKAVNNCSILENNVLEIITNNTQEKSPKIVKIVETILQLDEKEAASLKIMKLAGN